MNRGLPRIRVLGAKRAFWGGGSGCLVRRRLRRHDKFLGLGARAVVSSATSRGIEVSFGRGLRLLGARALERGLEVLRVCCLDSGVDRVVSRL